jgi:peptidoglycan/xylan/chitin deacetylase (PgdA/CDA1 family)
MAYRFDRAMTLRVIQPLSTFMPGGSSAIPILMYHSISDEQGPQMHPYYETRTSVGRFAEHLQWLYQWGYRTISLEEMVSPAGNHKPGAKQVVITFDDGFQDFYRNAVPHLSETGFTATMFLPTGFVSDARQTFKQRTCMTWGEVRELQRAGFTFGSHTVTHPQLHSLADEAILHEVKTSKQTIEDATGVPVTSFAYPYAFPETDRIFAERLSGTLQQCGYRSAVSTIIGTVQPGSAGFFLKRLPINDWDDLDLFQAKLNGAYNWMHSAQWFKKRIKRTIA